VRNQPDRTPISSPFSKRNELIFTGEVKDDQNQSGWGSGEIGLFGRLFAAQKARNCRQSTFQAANKNRAPQKKSEGGTLAIKELVDSARRPAHTKRSYKTFRRDRRYFLATIVGKGGEPSWQKKKYSGEKFKGRGQNSQMRNSPANEGF